MMVTMRALRHRSACHCRPALCTDGDHGNDPAFIPISAPPKPAPLLPFLPRLPLVQNRLGETAQAISCRIQILEVGVPVLQQQQQQPQPQLQQQQQQQRTILLWVCQLHLLPWSLLIVFLVFGGLLYD